jgi:hypothetical protein
MGGRGSGRRWYYGAADCTDEYRSLDVRRWERDGLLMPGRWFGWQWGRDGEIVASIQVVAETDRVTLSYRHRRSGEDWKREEYPVGLTRTPCAFGGRRAWFFCPAAGCGRRGRAVLGAHREPVGAEQVGTHLPAVRPLPASVSVRRIGCRSFAVRSAALRAANSGWGS